MITYKNANTSDLKTIAKVHAECFENYFLTSLGLNLLEKYYEEYMKEGAPFIVAVNKSNEIIGFCMGYQSGTKARANFENRYKYQLAAKLFLLCIKCDRMAWDRVILKIRSCIKSVKNKRKKNKSVKNPDSIFGGVLSICVLDKFRGTDVASSLLQNFERELKLRGINRYNLSVYKDNTRARNFYEKMGLKVCSEYNDSVGYMKIFD